MPEPQDATKGFNRQRLGAVFLGLGIVIGLPGVIGVLCETAGGGCFPGGWEGCYAYSQACMLLSGLCIVVNMILTTVPRSSSSGDKQDGQEGGSA